MHQVRLYKQKVEIHSNVFLFQAPEDVCEELKDGQWPDPSDCKSYFLCRGVGSQWGEQKREVCYTGRKKISSIHRHIFLLQVLTLIQMRKPVNGWAWIRFVYFLNSLSLSRFFH
jgi:hypothetical protein